MDEGNEEPWIIHRRAYLPDSPFLTSSTSSEDGSFQSDSLDEEAETPYAEFPCNLLYDFNQVAADFSLGSPKTPRSSTPRPNVIECPGAPSTRGQRQMLRQSSLSETKLLMTTQLKRTYSNFLFDKHFEYIREVGQGSSSKVYEARDRRNGTQCAVKVSREPFFAREDRDKFLREIQSVACLPEHPNVVKYYRGWQQDSHFHLQMELCEGGSLRNYLDTKVGLLEEAKVWSFIHQVASGLEHIHSHGVLHLDIKPENILLTSEGTLKICDFGLAVQKQNLWDWEEGDGAYVAPELLRDQDPGPEADMFSFGVMVYEWATGELLPRTNPEVQVVVKLPSCRSPALNTLVRSLLDLEPTKRPTAKQVLQIQAE